MRLTSGVLGGSSDVLGGPVVGAPEVGLSDAVDEVVDDVDGARHLEGAGDRLLVRRVEVHRLHVVEPAEVGEASDVATGDHDLVAVRQQSGH